MRLPQILLSAFLGIGLLLSAGCGDARIKTVENGVAHVKRLLLETKKNPIARASLEGRTITQYIASSTASAEGLPRFIDGGPPEPFSVVISRDANTGEWVIEGYGEKTGQPIQKATVK